MKRKKLTQSLVLAGTLAAGFLAVWAVLTFWALEVASYVTVGMDTRTTLIIPLRAFLTFLSDGTPVIGYPHPGKKRELSDLQGNVVAEPDGEDPFLTPLSLPAKLKVEESTDWDQRICSFTDGRVPSGFWYFIADGRRDGGGYFVGFDSYSRACLGYLGKNGLRDGPLPIEENVPFAGVITGSNTRLLCTQNPHQPTEHPWNRKPSRAPHGSVSSWDVYILGRDGKLYHADLQRRTIEIAFDRAPVLSATLVPGQHDAVHGTLCQPAVRTVDAVLVLDERGDVLKRYPIPEALRGQEIRFAETSTGEAVMYASTPEDFLATEIEYRICRVDSAGNCRQATTVLPFLAIKRFVPVAGLIIPSPLALAGAVASLRPSALLDYDLAATYPEALGKALTEVWTALVIAQMIAFAFAVLCYRRQVRYGASHMERIVWPLFVLFFGLPGWIGYRFGRSWPVLEACPDCGAAVPRDREICLRCTNEFPRPALRGTEVFS